MFTLRGTRDLLKKLGVPSSAIPPPPTTRLGDWYAKAFRVDRRQFVMCVSERTLLPVIVPGAPLRNLPLELPRQLASVLARLGVPPALALEETLAMFPMGFGPTANRSVVGFLNEFVHAAPLRLAEDLQDVTGTSLWLSETPCGERFPDRATREAFEVAEPAPPGFEAARREALKALTTPANDDAQVRYAVVSATELELLKHMDYPCSEGVLASARPTRGGYRLEGSHFELEDLAGWVAGDANEEDRHGGSAKGQILGRIWEELESALKR